MTNDKICSLGYTSVKLRDKIFAPQMEKVKQYYLDIPNDDLLYGFRKRAGKKLAGNQLYGWYGGGVFHVFGQILGALAKFSLITGDKRMAEKADMLLEGWLECMEDDGYGLQNMPGKPNDPYYEFDKLLGGLVDNYVFLNNEKAKFAISRLTDWGIKYLNQDGRLTPEKPTSEWYTISENIYRAYAALGDEKYLKFAKIWEYPYYWNRFLDVENFDFPPRHAYSHVNTFGGAAMAYRLFGEDRYLDIIRNAYDIITSKYTYATGGYGPAESLFGKDGYLGENLLHTLDDGWGHTEVSCCSWAVFKLCRYLMEFTGDARYAGWVEQALYNMIGSILPPEPGGKIMYYADYYRDGAVKHCEDGRIWAPGGTFEWPCCSGTMPHAIAEYVNLVAFKGKAGIYISQYINSEIEVDCPDNKVMISVETDYPEEELIRFTVKPEQEKTVTLHFRKPVFSEKPEFIMNGETLAYGEEDGWLTVKRTWKYGDSFTLRIPMSLEFKSVDAKHPELGAFVYGPVVLAADVNGILEGDTSNLSLWIKALDEGDPLNFYTIQSSTKLYDNRRKILKPYYRIGKYEQYYMYSHVEQLKRI